MNRIPDWSHRIVLAAEPVSASKARDFVCLHLVERQLPSLVDDVRLVVSELATNAMAHARTPFTVTLSKTEETVLLAIQDGAPTVPVRAVSEVTDTGGRGLEIVALMSDEWGVRTDGGGLKSVWACFRREPDSEPVRG